MFRLPIRISAHTHAKLKALARNAHVPMSVIVERAVDEYDRRVFLDGCNADFAALRADPNAWTEELAERAVWDSTLMDGLEDD